MKLARVAVALMVVFALQLLSFRPAVGLASAKRPDTQAGDLDLSFGGTGTIMTQVSTATDSAAAVAMQEDGKIVVAGTGADANSEFVIARYNPDGTLDSTFHTDGIVVTRIGTTDVATDVAIQPDGRIVVGGFTYIGGHADLAIARYTSTGELDTTFGGGDGVVTTTIGANSDDTIQAIELQPDGRIVVAGSRWATDTDFVVARYKLDGSLDPTFSGDGIARISLSPTYDGATDVAIDSTGRVVAVGETAINVADSDFAAVRFNANGSLDSTFDGDGIVTTPIGVGDVIERAWGVAIQGDGKIVVGGMTAGIQGDLALVRYDSEGSLDPTFDGDGKVVTDLGGSSQEIYDVALQSDGRILVVGDSGQGGPNFLVVRYTTAGSLDPTFSGDGFVETPIGDSFSWAYGVALQTNNRVVVVGQAFDSSFAFALARYFTEPPVASTLTMSAQPERPAPGAPVELTGKLSFDDGASALGKIIHLSRINPDGSTTQLADQIADAEGNFSTSDTPPGTGPYTYSAHFAGDDVHDLADASDSVLVIGQGGPADFNGDGYSDLAVGVPWEDEGTTDSGGINVIYGTASGLSAPGNQFFDEVDAGFSSFGIYDGFGFSSAPGDFNGDGFADLAASAPARVIGGDTYAGSVAILYGSPTGLSSTGRQLWNQDSTDILDSAETNDFFGWAVSAGDLNGDGYADLSVGVPGETVDTKAYAGAVNVIYGSSAGLVSTGNQFWSQNSTDINGKSETDDQFGLSLSIGDFDGSGFGDLAIGAPLENLTNGDDAGSVNVIYGSAAGLTSTNDQLWDQDSDNINDKVEKNDLFGYALASGDFDADGFDDLVSGVPEENLTAGSDGGAANVIYGTSAGLSSAGDQFWNQDKDGINDTVEKNDDFGAAVTAGDFDGDGYDDAVFGIPWEDIGTIVDGGAISVIYGTSGGLDDPNDDYWRQNSSGIEDTSETADLFGYSMIAGNFGNGPEDDLAVGVPLEGVNVSYQGAVNVLYGSPTDLTDVGNQFWNQDSTDILDVGEYDDEFGFGMAEPGTGGAAPVTTPGLRFVPTR